MKLRLIPEWRQAWRFNSVQLAALLTLLSLVQTQLLPQIEPVVPPKYWPYVTTAIGVAIGLVRIVQQVLPGRDHPAEEPKQ
jgi:hypothetical protein